MFNPFKREDWTEFAKRHWWQLLVAQAIIFFLAGWVMSWAMRTPETVTLPPSAANDMSGRTDEPQVAPQWWTCAMHPQIRQQKPGKCPICQMELVPVQPATGGLRTLTIDPVAKQLMQVESMPVERKYVSTEIRMVGKVDYDETQLAHITAWVSGRLDRLYVDYTGVQVKQGDHMVYIYSEELYSIQEELLRAIRFDRENPRQRSGGLDLAEAAREKLRLLGLTEQQIQQIEQRQKAEYHVTIYSPIGGIVIEKLKQIGDRVRLGDRIYTVADLSQVWVHLDAYESDLPWIRYGQEVTITTEANPGEKFNGRISFIQPVLNDKTRTVKVRVNVPNVEGKLKPDMFVHALARPRVAAGGRVMDPNLAGKWISPMHPEIVKDEPGTCDVCGMPLVRAESLNFVSAETDSQQPPLVIPYLAALVTGTRAIVYVQLPNMPSFADPAYQSLSSVMEHGKLEEVRDAFATFGRMLDRTYDQPGTNHAMNLWNQYADRFAQHALAGQRAQSASKAKQIFESIQTTMDEAREQFAPEAQPTFEGREIVLGPRAGDYYLVRHGVQEGELVVTQGNFKIDSEIQIQAKPSMMTPEGGGGGGGHDHGGGAEKKTAGDQHTQHQMPLPREFHEQVRSLELAYQGVAQAVEQGDASAVPNAFFQFGQTLNSMDYSMLSGHSRLLWKEFAMLLGNDAVEGSDVTELAEADRVFLVLKGHMRRMREKLGVDAEAEQHIERITVDPAFKTELGKIWQTYLPIQRALAADDLANAQQALSQIESALASIDEQSLSVPAQQVWHRERTSLTTLVTALYDAGDLTAFRKEFKPLSEEIGVLAKTFGFGPQFPVFELHCPMAFQGQGAVWYQDNDQTRNPYYGSTMLKCADRVEQVIHKSEENHSQH